MFKRIVVGILTVALSACMLLGCSFFSHDDERDLQQVIARVNAYEIKNSVIIKDDDGDQTSNDVTYTTEEKVVYKRDLVEYVNSNASDLSSSFGTDIEGLYRYAADMLVNIEIVNNEADALIDCGKIEWGVEQTNAIKRNIYSVIDNTITTIKNEILTGRGQESISSDDDSTVSTDTTYPVKPDADDDADDDADSNKTEEKPWTPDTVKWPGLHGDNDEQSLGREAMRRFIALIEDRVKDDFRIVGAERTNIDNEIKAINELIDTKGIVNVYPVIGTYPLSSDSPFGYIMYYLSGKSIERSQKISSLQTYITESVTVDTAEVVNRYTTLVNEQKTQFTESVAAFDTAMSGDTAVLYYPNTNYFYVKHILLPFSDEQKAALAEFTESPQIENLQQDEKTAKVNEYRARLADAIVCYPHENGEDDLSRPMSVDEVMAHVNSVMRPLAANVKRADTAFDDLIYLYNTDPGAFDNNKGYVVKYKLNDGEKETYKQEFADAARAMRDNIQVGQVYSEKVITDYGVHIMYLASTTKVGEVSLYDYTTPGELETYYDVLQEPIRTAREKAAYTTWENNILAYNYKNNATLYVDRFSNLWDD